ncbi:MAG: P-type conjugative transfer protein TrbJ [Burkholderia gladioli]
MKTRNYLAAAIFAAMATRAIAGAVTGGATEPTQILNNLELLNHTVQQAQSLKYQLQNLASLGSAADWGSAQSALANLASAVQQGQGLSYALAGADQVFAQRFPGYGNSGTGSFSQQYQTWSRTALDSIQGALAAAGLQANQFSSEAAAIASIRSMSAGSQGALSSIQAGNMVAGMQVEQLQKLRQLGMAQMQAQNTFMANIVQKQDSKQEGLKTMLNQQGAGVIPQMRQDVR